MNKMLINIFALLFAISMACVEEELKSSEKEILSFKVENQIGETNINSETHTINIIVSENTDLSNIIPVITKSKKNAG